MTNSQGGLSLPGIKCRSNLTSEFAEGKEENWPIKKVVRGFILVQGHDPEGSHYGKRAA